MAVAHEAYTRSHTTTNASANEASFSWDLLSTVADGVVVFIISTGNTSDLVTGVTCEGTAMTAVSGGRAVDTAGETGDCKAYFLGTGVAAGNLTITVTRTNNSVSMVGWAMSVTATADTEVYTAGIVLDQENGTLAERSVNDGSPGTDSLRYATLNSGLGTAPAVGSSTTSLDSQVYGLRCVVACRETTAGQGARGIGWSTATSDDRAGVYLAIKDASVGIAIPIAAYHYNHHLGSMAS